MFKALAFVLACACQSLRFKFCNDSGPAVERSVVCIDYLYNTVLKARIPYLLRLKFVRRIEICVLGSEALCVSYNWLCAKSLGTNGDQHTCTCIHTHAHIQIDTRVHTDRHTHTYRLIHTHVQIHTHTHIRQKSTKIELNQRYCHNIHVVYFPLQISHLQHQTFKSFSQKRTQIKHTLMHKYAK